MAIRGVVEAVRKLNVGKSAAAAEQVAAKVATKGAKPVESWVGAGIGRRAAANTYAESTKKFGESLEWMNRASTQREIVAASVAGSKAADGILASLTEGLAQQHAARGNMAAYERVMAESKAFAAKLEGPSGYKLDAKRGTMGSVDDNLVRTSTVMKEVKRLASELTAVNKLPAGDSQSAMNAAASGRLTLAQSRLGLDLINNLGKPGSEATVRKTLEFFKTLSRKVEKQVSGDGTGSMAVGERADIAAAEINAFRKKIAL